MMDNLLKQHPSLIKSLSLDLSIPSKKSQQDILIDHSEWLLTESAECGNKVADLVLQALNEQKTPKKNTNPTKYLNFLGDDNEEQSLLIDDIRISENYFKY